MRLQLSLTSYHSPALVHRISFTPSMERGGGGSSRPNSFYSQTSTSSCCSIGDSKAEMRDLMDSFIADVQRIRESFVDPSAAPAATPARSDGDVDMAPPVPGAYRVDSPPPIDLTYEHKGIWCDSCSQKVLGIRHKCLDCYNFDLCNSCMTTKDIQSTHADMPHTFEAIQPPKPKPAPKVPRAGSRPSSPKPSSPLPKCLCSVLPRPLGCEVCRPKQAPAQAPKAAPSYRCDSCQNIIGGTRHKCMNCPDYDLCEACYTSGFPVFDHSPVHRFMHIEHPVRVVTAPSMSVSDNISPFVGGCTHEGPRYKCENCDDVDLCTSCLGSLERATIQHAAWHNEQRFDKPVRFVPYTKDIKPQTPTPSTVPLPVHAAECDACDKTIVGTRHKCTVCHDFDLCDVCFQASAQPLSHKTEHDMLRLERPQRIVTHVVGSERGAATRPVATSSIGTATPAAIHNAWCDSCSERIRGVRHKCLDCADFDFCNGCVGTGSSEHSNGQHTFYALSEPGQVVVRDIPEEPLRPRGRPVASVETLPPSIPAPPAAPVVPPAHQEPRPVRPGPPSHSAACDMCTSRIRGVRYKCTACPDYDVCESCFRVSEEVHPGHSFAKVYKQGDIITRKSSRSSFRHHARCDVCQKQIMGVRYKCIHPSCPDFDICERCEAMPFAVHPETHALVKLRSHISDYDGLKNVINFAAGRTQAPQPLPFTIQAPVPIVRIPTPRLHVPIPRVSGSPIATYPEPMTGTDVFHTATPSPIVPLSTLGCTIVPHSTIVPSLPHTPIPEPPRMSPLVVSPPAIPSPIPSPPPIPVAQPTPERKLTDSWSAASSSAKLDEHKMHHSDMYKPSYEPPVVPTSRAEARQAEIEGRRARLAELFQPRGRRTHAVETAPPHPSVTMQEERDPEAPQMTLLNSRPVSLPDVPVHEPQVIRVFTPEPVPIAIPEPVVVSARSPSPVLVAEHEPVVAESEPAVAHVVERGPTTVARSESGSESESEIVMITEPAVTPELVGVAPEPVATPEPELPSLLPAYPYRSSPLPDMASLASSPSPSISSASIVSYTSPFEAAFIEDKTIVDGQVVSGGAEFSKIWRMRNTGTVSWPKGTTISFVGGHHMTTTPHWAVGGDLSPGQDIDVEVDMKAPEEPGQYASTWRLKTPEGEAFGSAVWCDIIVAEIERAGSSGNSEVSASSIIVPTRAPGMSVATISTAPASPEVQSVTTTIRSVTDMADDDDDDMSLGSEDSDDSIWDEVRRRVQSTTSR